MTLRTEVSDTHRRLDDINTRLKQAMATNNATWAKGFAVSLVGLLLAFAALQAESFYERQDKIEQEMTYHG